MAEIGGILFWGFWRGDVVGCGVGETGLMDVGFKLFSSPIERGWQTVRSSENRIGTWGAMALWAVCHVVVGVDASAVAIGACGAS
jgi:hypothetical protein